MEFEYSEMTKSQQVGWGLVLGGVLFLMFVLFIYLGVPA